MYIGIYRIVIEKEEGKLEFDFGGYYFVFLIWLVVIGGGSGGMV